MKILFSAITATALLLTASLAMAGDAPGATDATQSRPKLELKGIALGDDMDAVKAKLPNADCESFGDGSASQCYVDAITIAEKPAALLVRFLEGKVVSVSATRMTQSDAFAAGDALKIKFGAPDYTKDKRVTIHRRSQNRSVAYTLPVWEEGEGQQVLFVDPARYTDQDEQFTYAAVLLIDQHLHNDIWMAKKEGRATAANDL
jgi:hypothetical protein